MELAEIRKLSLEKLTDMGVKINEELKRRAAIQEKLSELNTAMYNVFMDLCTYDGHLDIYNSATGEILFSLYPEMFKETRDFEERPAFILTGGQD